jgi:cephalosporin hydroxylase
MTSYKKEIQARVASYSANKELSDAADRFLCASIAPKYSYNFSWHGRPIIQYPQDIIAMQEILWDVAPDLIIETGIAHGGSLIFYASILTMLDIADSIESGELYDPTHPGRRVLGIDIEIRDHNKEEIDKHPMRSKIDLIEGSSTSQGTVRKVKRYAKGKKRVMVCLDSNHTHEHVLRELELYAPLTSVGSYCVVFDTLIEDMPEDAYPDRPWSRGNNPKTAVLEYIARDPNFIVDKAIEEKLLITVARGGYLKRIG